MDHNVCVSFVCQRCLQPLSLDQSFNQVGEHKKAELSCKIFILGELLPLAHQVINRKLRFTFQCRYLHLLK